MGAVQTEFHYLGEYNGMIELCNSKAQILFPLSKHLESALK